jgi:outer membrane protein insertion porin family
MLRPHGLRDRSLGYRVSRAIGWILCAALVSTLAPVTEAHAEKPDNTALAPSYAIEAIEILGAKKTREYVIRQALSVKVGQRLSVEDARFRASRYRVLALGFFSEVNLRLKKGSRRGRVILVLEVVERGTIVLSDLYFGVSAATNAWGGIGLAEKNFLGRGIALEGAFVLGADPDVERAALQQSYWIRVSAPRVGGGPIELSASFIYLDGSEFFQQSGPESSSRPSDFLSVRYKRIGGTFGLSFDIGRYTRLSIDYRAEALDAVIPRGAVWRHPAGRSQPIDFDISNGKTALSLVSTSLEYDTRSDPVLPESGTLFRLTADASTQLMASSYSYIKLTASYRRYFKLPWKHIVSIEALGGLIFGDAPFFEQFFIGDLSDLVPGRSLGLNFSTLPSRDIFGTNIDQKRYEELAIRTVVEYVIPWFRGGNWAYAGDLFFRVGLIFLSSKEDLVSRDVDLGAALPLDLTLDFGLRLDTRFGVFRLSIGNGLGRLPF